MKDWRSAVFLDRDGVIIENREDHVKDWSEVRFLEGVTEGLRRLAATPSVIVIVSNQAAIGRGLLDHEAAWRLHRRIVAEIESRGGRIDASYLCPHRPEDGCLCRKPAPGMLRQAACDLGLDLGASWLVGDAVRDLEAAATVGARGILVLTGRGAEHLPRLSPEMRARWPVVADLPAAIAMILGRRR